jgi:surface antigen
MAIEQCYVLARRKWDEKYPNNKLVSGASAYNAPTLWSYAGQTSNTYKRVAKGGTAVANSIVCWSDGGDGHVAWVRSVNANGTMNITESNWAGVGETNRDNISFADRPSYGNTSITLLGCVYP